MRVGNKWVAPTHRVFVNLHKVIVAILLPGPQHAVDVVFQPQDGPDEGVFLLLRHISMVATNIHIAKSPLVVCPMKSEFLMKEMPVHPYRQSL
ncbi:hypothetical protein D3C87_1988330 [compost metagenome]